MVHELVKLFVQIIALTYSPVKGLAIMIDYFILEFLKALNEDEELRLAQRGDDMSENCIFEKVLCYAAFKSFSSLLL